MKRDLNQDVFCKINSHLGDVDNDPHTPRSNGSMRSIEKSKKRNKRGHVVRIQSEADIDDQLNRIGAEGGGFRPTFTINQGVGTKPMGFRLHSASVDEKFMDVKRF